MMNWFKKLPEPKETELLFKYVNLDTGAIESTNLSCFYYDEEDIQYSLEDNMSRSFISVGPFSLVSIKPLKIEVRPEEIKND
jgi:hypothetical protein